MVELDVRLNRDEEVIVLHDRTLQRTTTGNGKARNSTTAELRTFDAGSWFHPAFRDQHVPTLREVMTSVGDHLWFDIEIKSDWPHREPPGLLERRVLETVRGLNMMDRVMFSSFDHRLIANVKSLAPDSVTGALYNLYWDFPHSPSYFHERTGAEVFVCARHELRRSFVEDAHRVGMAVYVYTIDIPSDIQAMMSMGIDGIISNAADDVVPIIQSGWNRP
jgi:glycerophosphoryl diester phosphodiesterase